MKTTTIEWKGGMAFEATPPSGNRFTMDAYPEVGGKELGPTPLEAFVAGAAACSAMDVIHILRMKRQRVDSYRVEVDGDRNETGSYPRPFSALRIRHVVGGEVDSKALEDAVRESDARFCSAIATLRSAPKVTSEWSLESSGALA